MVLGSVTAVPLSLYALILCVTCTFLPCSHFLSLHKMGLILPPTPGVCMDAGMCVSVFVCMRVHGSQWSMLCITIHLYFEAGSLTRTRG